VCVERRPVDHGITGAALPARVSATAVTEADDMPDARLMPDELLRWGQVGVRWGTASAGE